MEPAVLNHEEYAIQVHKRLKEFVEDFVFIYESYFSEYFERLKKNILKSGKGADFVSEVIEKGKGGMEGGAEAERTATSIVAVNIIQKLVSSVGGKYNRERLKTLTQKLYEFRNEPAKVRRMLVESGIEVFQKFESQFMRATSRHPSKSWQRAMEKLANDAANRVINYYKENPDKDLTSSVITEGIILGQSRRGTYTFVDCVPKLSKGHSLELNISHGNILKANTAELFEEVGLIIGDSNDNYKKSSLSAKYGFRSLFQWEYNNMELSNDVLVFKNNNRCYTKLEHTLSNKNQYLLTEESQEEKQRYILNGLDCQDQTMATRLDGVRDIVRIKQDSKENAKDLSKFVKRNFDEIENFFKEVRQGLPEIRKLNKKNLEIASEDLEADKEILVRVETTSEELDLIPDGLLVRQTSQKSYFSEILESDIKRNSTQDRTPVWFEVREPIISFTGRQEQLQQISGAVEQGVFVISGLPGVGKTELALKYVRSQYTDKDNVIWIDAKAVKKSFFRLYKKLGFKINDEDGDEKCLRSVADDVYEYLNFGRSIVIFDNVEDNALLEGCLPVNLPGNSRKPFVLITSSFSKWEHARISIKQLTLRDFSDGEARKFTKQELGIIDNSQNEDITNLAKELHNFPLALQQAVAYIRDRRETYQKRNLEFNIKNYLDKYKRIPEELLNVELPSGTYAETIFKILQMTLDKIRNEEYGEKSLSMLSVISYFAPNNIPEQIFLRSLANGDQDVLFSITSLLEKYIVLRLEQGMLNVHGLVQLVRRLQLNHLKEEEEILAKALELLKTYMKDRNSMLICSPHIISIWDYASSYHNLIEKFLVDEVKDSNASYTTYFHLIVECSNYKVVQLIIDKIEKHRSDMLKKILISKTEDRATPLHHAILNTSKEVAGLLVAKGANVNASNKHGWTPLHLASKSGSVEIAKILLDNRANVNAKTGYEFTPLHLAARNGYSEIVKLLLSMNAEVNADDQHKYTPLHFSAKLGHLGVVEALLNHNEINADAQTEYKLTPLHFAAKEGHTSIAKVLLDRNANVNGIDNGKFTALHLAAFNNHKEVVNILLKQADIEVNLLTTKGNTPLHLAAEKGNIEIIQALVSKGADLNISNEEGKSAFDLVPQEREIIFGKYFTNREEFEVIMPDLTFNKRDGTSGMGGQLYEILLIMLHLLQGMARKDKEVIDEFLLASNVDEAGDFDDVVFKYNYNERGVKKLKVIFFQAKHKETVTGAREKKISIDTLLSQSQKGDFLLRKYLSSYSKIEQRFKLKTNHPIFANGLEVCNLIIYTNALFDFNRSRGNIIQEETEIDNILKVRENNNYYAVIASEEVIQALKPSLDFEILVKELVQSVCLGSIDKNKLIFQDYHIPLVERVIERKNPREGILRESFLDVIEEKEFGMAFFEELRNKKDYVNKSTESLKEQLKKKVLQLPIYFGINRANVLEITKLPKKEFSVKEIETFLKKLRLFVNQPNESELGKILKNQIQSIYRVEENDIDTVFSHVEYKVRKWWREEKVYLTENNEFFQESVRISIWFDVKKPIDLFTGRRDELNDLDEMIHRNPEKVTVISQMTSISGLGGIGKTELARQYIQEHSKGFDNNIIWINAENELTLIESFARLAKDKLKINTQDANGNEKDVQSYVAEIYAFFSKRKSLFIFDNSEKGEYLKNFLPLRSLTPNSNKPYVLLTSRVREWERGIEVMDLNEMKLSDAIEFVKKGLGISDTSQDEDIKDLVEKLQCFPLAIQQAISYIEDQNLTTDYNVEDYLIEYKRRTEILLNSKAFQGIDNDYAKTTYTTWQITISKISASEVHGALALNILNAIAYFASDNIQRDIFVSLAHGCDEDVRAAVRLLVKYSMLNGQDKQRILGIHRLVQEVTRLELVSQEKEEATLEKVLKLIDTNLGKENLDHGVSLWTYASKYKALVAENCELPSRIIDALSDQFRYQEARLFGDESVESLKSALGSVHLTTLKTQRNIAQVLDKHGKFEEAFKAYQDIYDIQIRPDVLGQHHQNSLNIKHEMALVLSHLGNFDKALTVFQETLDQKKIILGVEHKDTLDTMSAIGEVLYQQGKYDDALRLYQEVLEVQSRPDVLGPTHSDTLSTKHNMAMVLNIGGTFKEAVKLYREVLEVDESVLGPDHPVTLKTKHNIAVVLYNQGKYKESLGVHREVFIKHKEVLGAEHPKTLMFQANMALVLDNMGEFKEALKLYKDVFDKAKVVLGEDHPETLMTKHNMALVLLNEGQYGEALPIFQDVFEKRKEILGLEHAYTLTARNSIGITILKQGRYEEAREIFQVISDIYNSTLGKDHPYALNTQNNLAIAWCKLGRHVEALQLFQEVLGKRQLSLGSDHSYTLFTKSNMAEVLGKLGRYDEALQTFLEVYRVQENPEILGVDNPRYLFSKNGYGEMLEKLGRDEEALDVLKDVLERRKVKLGDDHPDTLTTLHDIARVIGKQGHFKESIEAFQQVYKTRKLKLGDMHPDTKETRDNINSLLNLQKDNCHK